jgi:phage gpG-like protein
MVITFVGFDEDTQAMTSLFETEWLTMCRSLLRRMGDLSPVLREIGEILVPAQKNFRVGGGYGNDNELGGGSRNWVASAAARDHKGQTLIKTAVLRSSISHRVIGDALPVGTNVPYVAINIFGGTSGRNGGVHLPAHPFMVVQNEDLSGIQETLTDYNSAFL